MLTQRYFVFFLGPDANAAPDVACRPSVTMADCWPRDIEVFVVDWADDEDHAKEQCWDANPGARIQEVVPIYGMNVYFPDDDATDGCIGVPIDPDDCEIWEYAVDFPDVQSAERLMET